MLRDRRDVGRRFRGALGFGVLLVVLGALSACTVVAGGGIAAALVGVSALTSHCYDYLDVTVYDAQGRKTCAATVTASRNESSEQFQLQSCYYTPLSDGRWTLRAALPGSTDAVSTVEVEHQEGCTRHVQSVELTLDAVGASPRAPVPAASGTSAPPAPAASTAIPPAIMVPPAPSTAPSALPAASGGAAGASSSSDPSAAGSPSIGVFPNQSDSSH